MLVGEFPATSFKSEVGILSSKSDAISYDTSLFLGACGEMLRRERVDKISPNQQTDE